MPAPACVSRSLRFRPPLRNLFTNHENHSPRPPFRENHTLRLIRFQPRPSARVVERSPHLIAKAKRHISLALLDIEALALTVVRLTPEREAVDGSRSRRAAARAVADRSVWLVRREDGVARTLPRADCGACERDRPSAAYLRCRCPPARLGDRPILRLLGGGGAACVLAMPRTCGLLRSPEPS